MPIVGRRPRQHNPEDTPDSCATIEPGKKLFPPAPFAWSFPVGQALRRIENSSWGSPMGTKNGLHFFAVPGGKTTTYVKLKCRQNCPTKPPAGIRKIDFADEVATANALVPKLKERGHQVDRRAAPRGRRARRRTAYNDCTGVSGAGPGDRAGPQARDRRGRERAHPPAVQLRGPGPQGHPRLLTSASSLGRIVTKLHFLIDPASAGTSCGRRPSPRT